jgi:hypothetical protein
MLLSVYYSIMPLKFFSDPLFVTDNHEIKFQWHREFTQGILAQCQNVVKLNNNYSPDIMLSNIKEMNWIK